MTAVAGAAQAGFLGVWLLGVSVGLTACTAACLPFIGTWVLGRAGRDGGGPDIAAFLAGRLLGYVALGAAAGAAGGWLADSLSGPAGHFAIGAAGLFAGGALALGKPAVVCGVSRRAGAVAPFALGLALSLTPCAPLSSLLVAAALAGDPWRGGGFGLAFGLGAAVTPLVVAVPLVAALGRRIGRRSGALGRWLRLGSGGVLAAIGLRRLMLGLAGM